jgi:hypothetical protein
LPPSPGDEEEVGVSGLVGVEVVVAAVELVEGLVGSALYDLALFDDKNLVGSLDDLGRNFRVAGHPPGTA